LLYNPNTTGKISKEIIYKNPIKSKINFKNKNENNNIRDGYIKDENFSQSLSNNIDEPSPDNDYNKSREQLERKTQLYEKLKSTKIIDDKDLILLKESCSIDFDMKRLEEKEKLKKIINDKPDEEEFYDSGHQLSNIIKAENEFIMNQFSQSSSSKTHVKQSYDKVLTLDEKKALSKVKEEEGEYKNKLELLKRKKNIEREERIERIKKMKI
jgi:hypothetical protein